ncbi:MAG: KEOPS complex subunit Cgi121 [Candidatus Bathyarchaeales archaeon]
MLKYIEEAEKCVEITAFRNVGAAKVEKLLKAVARKEPQQVWIQFFNAELIATWQHLYFAVLNALVAFKNERNISKSLAMEVMLYASAQRQIRKAIELMGVKEETKSVAVVLIGDKPDQIKTALSAVSEAIGAMPDERALELSEEKAWRIREAFLISDEELEAVKSKDDTEQALVKLVLERVALLATRL